MEETEVLQTSGLRSRRGFAAMDKEKQRAIASKGGKSAHAQGVAHTFTPAQAKAAGRKGGRAAHARGKAHRFTHEQAVEAGKKGGRARKATLDAKEAVNESPSPTQ